jgi:flagella basal body P-ring formation protein FlgA
MTFCRIVFVCAALLQLCSFTASAETGMRIDFLPEAEVEGQTLHLNDVARMTPASAAERWGNVALFQVPEYGAVRTYRASTLKAYVLQQVDMGGEVSWGGAEHVRVSRAGEVVSDKAMIEVVADFVRRRLDRPEISRVHFEPSRTPHPFTLPDADWECEVVPSASNVLSARRFNLLFRRQGRLVHETTVYGRVQAEAEVVVARRDLRRDATLRPDDLRLEHQRLSRLDNPVFTPAAAVGKRVKRTVRSGQVVEQSVLAAPILVERGKPVTLEAVKGALMITASGIAQEDGGLRETIRVENSRSGKEVFGTVVAADTVRVRF